MLNMFYSAPMNNGDFMHKEFHAIRMSPDTRRKLKVKAAQVGVPQGELVGLLLDLEEKGELTMTQVSEALARNYFLANLDDFEALLKKWGVR